MKRIKDFRSFFESKIDESSSLKNGGIYYYYTSYSDSYALPEIKAYEDSIPFDEEASEWNFTSLSARDLFNEYIGQEIRDLNIDKLVDQVYDATHYDDETAIETIEELLNDYDLEVKYSAESIVNDPEYAKKFFKEVTDSRGEIINDIKDRRFKKFKERLYHYDKVWDFIVVGDVEPNTRWEIEVGNNLYNGLQWLSGATEGNSVILAYCSEEENFHTLDKDNVFTDTGISVETTEKSEEDEITRIVSDLEISNNPNFIASLPIEIARKIYNAKGLPQEELNALRDVKSLGLF